MSQPRLPDKAAPIPGSLSHIPRDVLFAAAIAFLLKIAIALTTYGSTDVLIFESDLSKVARDGGIALYRDGIDTEWCGQPEARPCPPFNHPPFVIHALKGWAFLANASGVPFPFWLRLTCALADLGSLALLARLLPGRLDEARTRAALLWFALSPISILISGFHGNTDSILMFFTLLVVGLIEERRSAWLAGVAFGVATNVKVLPLLLAPAALLSLRGARSRLQFCLGTGATVLIGSLPYLVVAPGLVLMRVLGYRSQFGTWGLSLLALLSREKAPVAWLGDVYLRHGKFLSLLLVVGATFWLRPLSRRNVLFMQTGFLLFLLVAAIPGFGVQYLAWLVPFVVGLGSGPATLYHVAGTAFLVAYYNTAAGTFPWYFANSLARPAWSGTVLGLGLICWVVVCVIAFIYARRLLVLQVELRAREEVAEDHLGAGRVPK